MVGRDDELDRLRELVSGPQSRVAVVAGEPGVGKSRLVQELLAGLPPVTTVLVGQADPGALGRPFELLLDAVAEREGAAAERLGQLTDPSHSLVERLHIGLEIVRSLTDQGRAVLVFEDLHWADSESIALFERIADLPGGSRVLIGTYRPEELTRRNPVAELLGRLERRHSISHLRLERFTLADTSAFLTAATGSTPSYRAAVALHKRTGGNPFFLEELLKAGGDDLDLDKLWQSPLPWSLAEALRQQVDDLDPALRRIVEAAAVLGRKVPFDLLAAVTRVPEDDLIAVLRELVERGLLIELGEDEFGFRHALTREAIADQMLGRQRRRLHELALENLLASGSTDMALVAHHAKGAGRYDDLVAAARRGCESYLAIGSAYQALVLAEDGLCEVPEDLELLAGAARGAWLAGLTDDATRYAQRWRAAARTPDERAAALQMLIRLAWEDRRRTEMDALTDEIRQVIDELPHGPHRARAINNLLSDVPPQGLPGFGELLERMRDAAEKAGFEALGVAAYFQGRARLAMQEGDLAAAITALEEGRRRDRGMLRTSRGGDYHGYFLSGLLLEAVDLDRAEPIIAGLTSESPTGLLSVVGLELHLACRRRDAEQAPVQLGRLLDIMATVRRASGDHLHDLVSAGLNASLPIPDLRRLVELAGEPAPDDPWHRLVVAQLDEAGTADAGAAGDALSGYLAAAEAAELPPAARGTAHAGAARCLIALGWLEEARTHVTAAAQALARWSGWRVAEGEALRGRVGRPARGVGAPHYAFSDTIRCRAGASFRRPRTAARPSLNARSGTWEYSRRTAAAYR